MKNTKLSNHFTLAEFCKPGKYPDNIPTSQHVENMVLCHNRNFLNGEYFF